MSMIYKLDPRTKIAVVILFTVLIFLVDNLPASVCLMIFVFLLRLAAKIPFSGGRQLKMFSMLVVFLIVTQILFGPGENYIVKPLFPPFFPILGGKGSLKWDGLFIGLMIGCRLAALALLLPLLTASTPPESIAAGLGALGINYRICFIITTAFNLIPIFEESARVIMDAQRLRGMCAFEKRSFFAKLKAYPGLVVPLVLGAMRKARLVSIAMDSRAFGVYSTRTWLEKPRMTARDFAVFGFCAVFFAAMLFLNFKLK